MLLCEFLIAWSYFSCLPWVLVTLLINLSLNSFSLASCGMYRIRDAVQASLYQTLQAFKMVYFSISSTHFFHASHHIKWLFDYFIHFCDYIPGLLSLIESCQLLTHKTNLPQNIKLWWKAMKYNIFTAQQWDWLHATSGPVLFLMKSVVPFLSQ